MVAALQVAPLNNTQEKGLNGQSHVVYALLQL